MDSLDEAHALAATQHGVITRPQALKCGVTDAMLARLLRNGSWNKLQPGTYALTEPVYASHVTAGLLAIGGGALASHHTVGALHGFVEPVFPVRFTLPRATFRRCHSGVRIYRSDVAPEDSTTLLGIAATSAMRSVLDVAIAESTLAAVCFAEAAIRSGALEAAAISAAFDASYRRRRGHRARRALAQVDPCSESELETRLRLLLIEHGLIPPETQWPVRNGRGVVIARADFAWPAMRLIVEADGVGPHGSPEALLRDRQRQNALINEGYRVLRFTWYDVTQRPAYVIAAIRSALGR